MSDLLDDLTKLMDSESEPRSDEYDVYIQCAKCFEWTFVEGNLEMHVSMGGYRKGQKCGNCGSTNFDPRSTISKRTFNPVTAKKRRPTGVKRKR